MVKEDRLYKTQDLYLASFLKARGLKLVRIGRRGNVAVFYFKHTDDIARIVTSFYNGKELVNANNLIGSIRDLKSIVHNLRNEVDSYE